MSRQPNDQEWWDKELAFVLAEAGKPANERMGGFEPYVQMQAQFATRDGFGDIDNKMLQALQISQSSLLPFRLAEPGK